MRSVCKTLIVLAILSVTCPGAEEVVGSIKTVTGKAVVVRGGQTIPAAEGLHLLPNDILRTAGDGRLGAILQDGTGIGLGPDSELKIDSFLYEPANGKLGLAL